MHRNIQFLSQPERPFVVYQHGYYRQGPNCGIPLPALPFIYLLLLKWLYEAFGKSCHNRQHVIGWIRQCTKAEHAPRHADSGR